MEIRTFSGLKPRSVSAHRDGYIDDPLFEHAELNAMYAQGGTALPGKPGGGQDPDRHVAIVMIQTEGIRKGVLCSETAPMTPATIHSMLFPRR